MTGPEFERGVIALACFRAGQTAGEVGMLAVACVLRNQGGHLYTQALLLPEMAQGWDEDGMQMYPDPREPRFAAFLAGLDNVLAGRTKDITNGGVVYRRAGQDEPFGRQRISTIGTMTFYR